MFKLAEKEKTEIKVCECRPFDPVVLFGESFQFSGDPSTPFLIARGDHHESTKRVFNAAGVGFENRHKWCFEHGWTTKKTDTTTFPVCKDLHALSEMIHAFREIEQGRMSVDGTPQSGVTYSVGDYVRLFDCPYKIRDYMYGYFLDPETVDNRTRVRELFDKAGIGYHKAREWCETAGWTNDHDGGIFPWLKSLEAVNEFIHEIQKLETQQKLLEAKGARISTLKENPIKADKPSWSSDMCIVALSKETESKKVALPEEAEFKKDDLRIKRNIKNIIINL